MDLSKYSIDELVELKNKINGMIYNHRDGYFYICNVRSYGRNWLEIGVFNIHTLQDLCNEYGGDNGIVDVYSNNPNLSKLNNYGSVMFVPTKEDYIKWKDYDYLVNIIPSIEKELDKWDNRNNVAFRERPIFEPHYDYDNLEILKKELDDYDMSFVVPVIVAYEEDQEDDPFQDL
jgi:hypothetical protein